MSLRGAALVQEVVVANEGQAALEFTAALHSYFRVADIHQVHSVPSVTRACTYIHLQVGSRTHQCQHDRTIAMRLRAVSLSRGPVSRWSWPNHPPRLTRAGTAASCHCTCMWTLCRWAVLVQGASPACQRPAGSCTSTCAGHLPVDPRSQGIVLLMHIPARNLRCICVLLSTAAAVMPSDNSFEVR